MKSNWIEGEKLHDDSLHIVSVFGQEIFLTKIYEILKVKLNHKIANEHNSILNSITDINEN